MSNIAVVGAGYVGLVTGTCFADLGNNVVCIDVDVSKIDRLCSGILPIYEPGLEELVRRSTGSKRLSFTSDYAVGLEQAEFIFIAVGTPSGEGGEADTTYIKDAAESIGRAINHPAIVVNKSTVPIGTGDLVHSIIIRTNPRASVSVVSNPEFLREGSALADFTHPDRVVLGASDRAAADSVATLYAALNCPILITDVRTAEMIKYASNAFLATRVSFINEIAAICDELGADVLEVARGMGLDDRIGADYLNAGIGFGGSCFPKDVRALAHMAEINGCHPQLLRSVMDINRDQRLRVVRWLRETLGGLEGRTVAVLGLSFKPDTDDVRESAPLDIIRLLQNEGVTVRAYDPVAMDSARNEVPEITFCDGPYDAAEGADAVVLATEWNEFRQIDHRRLLAALKQPVMVDGRNIYDPEHMRKLGFSYYGLGRGYGRTSESSAVALPNANAGASN